MCVGTLCTNAITSANGMILRAEPHSAGSTPPLRLEAQRVAKRAIRMAEKNTAQKLSRIFQKMPHVTQYDSGGWL